MFFFFYFACGYIEFNFRLKADYDDVVKKNQELENRILQLVICLFSSDPCYWLNVHELNIMLKCASAAEKLGTDNSVERKD